MDTLTPRIILASSSPRRKMLLNQVGILFDVMVQHVDEEVEDGLAPAQHAEHLALHKAQAVAASVHDAIVIGADTIVVDDQGILGKPRNSDEAFAMLSRLSGNIHQVMTGVALVSTCSPPQTLVRHERTQVKMTTLSEDDIRGYIQTGEPLDKAGAYGIQGKGAAFIEWIHGCYNNVVGLPLFLFMKMLHEITNTGG